MKTTDAEATGDDPSRLIDARIAELRDWRGETLARIRTLIKEADPEVVEEWKWRGVPTWYHDGKIICTRGETYKTRGEDDLRQGRVRSTTPQACSTRAWTATSGARSTSTKARKIDEKALTALVRAAVALNVSQRGTSS